MLYRSARERMLQNCFAFGVRRMPSAFISLIRGNYMKAQGRWSHLLSKEKVRRRVVTAIVAVVLAAALLRLTARKQTCSDAITIRRSESCCGLPQVFDHGQEPGLSAIVYAPSGTKPSEQMSRMLRGKGVDEIIVCEDGTNHASVQEWASQFTELSHFVIRTNNLGLRSCFNRAMRSSSSPFFVLLREDTITAVDDLWIDTAKDLFEKFPELGVLGGSFGYIIQAKEKYEYGEMENPISAGLSSPTTRIIPFQTAHSGQPFMFTECVSGSPMFINAKLLRAVPGFDLEKPAAAADCILSRSAWMYGYHVGLFGARMYDLEPFSLEEIGAAVDAEDKLEHNPQRASIVNHVVELNDNILQERKS